MILGQCLKEGHPEHLPFPFVDTGGQEVVDVVAEQVPFEE